MAKTSFFKYMSLLFIIIICVICVSCNTEKGQCYQNKEYGEILKIAQEAQLPFCIVLVDDSCKVSIVYKKVLKKRSDLLSSAIFNFVDFSNKDYIEYKYWLGSDSAPMTCVFSQDGELKSIIYGASECAFNDIYASTRCDSSSLFGFGFHSVIGESANIIEALNYIWKSQKLANNEQEMSNWLNQSLQIIEYPYNNYLKYLSFKEQDNSDSVIVYAQKTCSFSDNSFSRIYHRLYEHINSEMIQVKDRAFLHFSKTEINLGCHYLNETIKFSTTIKNTGKLTLMINKIEPSCSCIKNKNQDEIRLEPMDSIDLHFELDATEKGEIYREIYIHSDALNSFEVLAVMANIK